MHVWALGLWCETPAEREKKERNFGRSWGRAVLGKGGPGEGRSWGRADSFIPNHFHPTLNPKTLNPKHLNT